MGSPSVVVVVDDTNLAAVEENGRGVVEEVALFSEAAVPAKTSGVNRVT